MKHTPGPWLISSSVMVVTKDGKIISQPVTGIAELQLPLKELMANASLIAAAPELLEACKYAKAALLADDNEKMAILKLQQAITKAEGINAQSL